jgi:hypothetical protein
MHAALADTEGAWLEMGGTRLRMLAVCCCCLLNCMLTRQALRACVGGADSFVKSFRLVSAQWASNGSAGGWSVFALPILAWLAAVYSKRL